MCGMCSSDTEHTEVSVIESPPNYLVILFNRFHFELNARRTETVILDLRTTISSTIT